MKLRKSSMLIIGIGLLLISSFSASAGSIDDNPNDVIHFKYDAINDWHFELAIESKPSIDIDKISLDIVGGQAVFKMTLYGNVMTDQLYLYMMTYNSDEVNYFLMYGAEEDGTEFSSGVWSTSTDGGAATSIIADGNELKATFDTDIEGSTNVDYWGVATQHVDAGDTTVEHWVDYAPDDKHEGTIIDPTDSNGDVICWQCNENNESVSQTFPAGTVCGEGDAEDYPYGTEPNCGNGATPKSGTPGFEILVVIASLGIAFIIVRRNKK